MIAFIQVSLDEANTVVQEQATSVAALDDALQRLEALDERQGKIVELRFFGGLSRQSPEFIQLMTGQKAYWEKLRVEFRS